LHPRLSLLSYDETFDSWALTHLTKTFPGLDHPAHGSASNTAHPFGAQQPPWPVAPAQQPPHPRPWTPVSLQPLKHWQRNWPQRPSQRWTRPHPTSGPPTLEPATKPGPCPVDSINPVFESLAKAPKHEKRTIARNFFQELSLQKDSFAGFSPSEELNDDLISGSYAPPLPATPSKWHQEFSPITFVARSVQDLAKQREQRDLTSHYNGLLQISYSECKKLESGPPTVPTSLPGVLDFLEKCAGFHGHCWGDRNGIAPDIKAIRYNLRRLQPRLANVPKFAPMPSRTTTTPSPWTAILRTRPCDYVGLIK
jgi:hypothetical protein